MFFFAMTSNGVGVGVHMNHKELYIAVYILCVYCLCLLW